MLNLTGCTTSSILPFHGKESTGIKLLLIATTTSICLLALINVFTVHALSSFQFPKIDISTYRAAITKAKYFQMKQDSRVVKSRRESKQVVCDVSYYNQSRASADTFPANPLC